jgi:hypothetical protein
MCGKSGFVMLLITQIVILALLESCTTQKIAKQSNEQINNIYGINKIAAKPESGFCFPYFLYVPEKIRRKINSNEQTYILVQPNNTGYPSTDFTIHEDSAEQYIKGRRIYANTLNCILLVPVFPRPPDMYVQALDEYTITSKKKELKRIDMQLLKMINDAKRILQDKNIKTKDKILMNGYSADGMFTNRFILIHPEIINAAAIGAPGGWPMVPIKENKSIKLNYPIGINDYRALFNKEFNLEAFRKIKIFIYASSDDDNRHIDKSYENTVKKVLGEDQKTIIGNVGEIYKSIGSNIKIKIYEGMNHEETNLYARNDVFIFFEEAMSRE